MVPTWSITGRTATPRTESSRPVLGLLAWIYSGVQVTVYAAEVNVVLARRLWPRSLVQLPLTDVRSYQ
jgi:hypothetical protein